MTTGGGVLTREQVVERILTLPPEEQAVAAQAALELYGPAIQEGPPSGLHEYVRNAWPTVERRPFVDNWHIGVITEHLEAVTNGEIANLIINIPPRHTKSLIVSVFWPSWEWTFQPWIQWLFSSYAEKLSKRDSLRMRRLIWSPWYQRRWGHVYQITSDQREKMRYETTAGGYRIATSVGGAGTGEGGDRVVVDDPHKAGAIESDAKREDATDWWDNEMSTRLNDPKTGGRVIIMQRLHDADLTGHVLKQGGYIHVRIPARYEPKPYSYVGGTPKPPEDPVEWSDPRTEPGEPLNPGRFGEEELAEIELRLGSYMTASQLQQRPTPAAGGIIKRHWWRFWKPQHSDLPDVTVSLPDGSHMAAVTLSIPVKVDKVIQSWDMSFKDKRDSSYVVGQVWGAKGADRYLLDQAREHAEFIRTLEMFRGLNKRWPQTQEKLVEDKANGPAIISTLHSEIGGIIPIEPDGDKAARLRAVSPQVESGNCYLPHPALAPWVWDFIEELAAAPLGDYDDQADGFSQALRRMGLSASLDPADWPTVRH